MGCGTLKRKGLICASASKKGKASHQRSLFYSRHLLSQVPESASFILAVIAAYLYKMMNAKDEELEFISVSADEDNELNNYMDPAAQNQEGSAIGGWILTQSKVTLLFLAYTLIFFVDILIY
jgi:hypothetical protein